jgi:hypothetical protein
MRRPRKLFKRAPHSTYRKGSAQSPEDRTNQDGTLKLIWLLYNSR